ncbi:hypothetical protein [Lysobacter sp. CA199]|uniref:hypothetical protein n=1 Tax=Lysobacter sp. CA199 TaxID=3455608 RepID=UPI003F8D0846
MSKNIFVVLPAARVVDTESFAAPTAALRHAQSQATTLRATHIVFEVASTLRVFPQLPSEPAAHGGGETANG